MFLFPFKIQKKKKKFKGVAFSNTTLLVRWIVKIKIDDSIMKAHNKFCIMNFGIVLVVLNILSLSVSKNIYIYFKFVNVGGLYRDISPWHT